MVFPGTTTCRVMTSFHNFMFFYFQFTVFFSVYKKSGAGVGMAPWPPVNAVPEKII